VRPGLNSPKGAKPRPESAPAPDEPKAPEPGARAIARAIAVLPPILELYESSPLHFIHPVQVLFDQLFPSLVNGQFRLLVKDAKPLAFVNWAWLSEAAATRYSETRHPVAPADWRSGPNLWCCEIVTREGAMPDLVRDLRHNVFAAGTRLRWLRIGPSGELQGIGDFRIP